MNHGGKGGKGPKMKSTKDHEKEMKSMMTAEMKKKYNSMMGGKK